MNAIAGKLFGTIVQPGQTGTPRLPKSSIEARKQLGGQTPKSYYGAGI